MRALIRAPWWFIGLLLLAAIFVGVYAYFTTPLPYGLGAYFQTPGGSAVPLATPAPTVVGVRAPAGQPLTLGAARATVQAVQRNEDLTTGGRGGPPGSFTVIDLLLQNAGTEPLAPHAADFRLLDDRGRVFAVDSEATRAMNAFGHRRNLFAASVPPGGQIATFVAFETAPDSTAATLRVSLGYGEAELPR